MGKILSMEVKMLFMDVGRQGTKQGKIVFLIAAFNTIGGFSVQHKITDEFGVCENS